MSRWKAAAIHISISALIGLISATLIFFVWYPRPYSHAAGADKLVLLLLGVDVVLGPLLTLIVFRAGKWGMRFDLVVIAIAQACAFVYGTSVVVRARPAFVVANVDRFTLVAANDIDEADYARATRPEFRSAPWSGPRIVGALPPTDIEERNKIVLAGPGGKDLPVLPQYYVEYDKVAQVLLLRAKPIDLLTKLHAESAPVIDDWMRSNKRTAGDTVWLPLKARRANLTMLLDRRSGQPLDAIPISPW
jgi:hypothetical protein